jgi:hypothetical protein
MIDNATAARYNNLWPGGAGPSHPEGIRCLPSRPLLMPSSWFGSAAGLLLAYTSIPATSTKRAAHRGGWQAAERAVYGKTVSKLYKTFLATYRPAGGAIRVAIILEDHEWVPLFCTDPNATAVETIEAFADRATIEQDFHDVKEVWATGQQQVRNIRTNLAVYLFGKCSGVVKRPKKFYGILVSIQTEVD